MPGVIIPSNSQRDTVEWAPVPEHRGAGMPQLNIHEILKQADLRIALVGATNDSRKYGNIIFRDLVHKGYEVFPVNPRAKTVEEKPAWPSLTALTEAEGPPHLINFVIPPKLTLPVIEEAVALNLDNLWFQPGAESVPALDMCEAHGLRYIAHACVMVEARGR